MKLSYNNIINKHKGEACVISLHGPSLSSHIDKIQELQRARKLKRFSVNEWFDFFDEEPDYWVVSNGEFTIEDSIINKGIWKQRQYPADAFNQYKSTLLYNKTSDLTDPEFVENNLNCDYLPYDNKHFKGHRCLEILQNFKEHYEENKNLDFKMYGNNAQMWQVPDSKNENVNQVCAKVHTGVGGGWSPTGKCCHMREGEGATLQETLQRHTGHEQHIGVGQTVGLFCVAFAILMGFEKIYIVGLDLDYTLGYAKGGDKPYYIPNIGNVGHWRYVFKEFLLDDMRILRESAELAGAKIVNLNKESWHNEFLKGEIEL